MANQVKIYILINKETNVKIECTEKYLMKWLARGFEVEEIVYRENGMRLKS